MSTEIDSAVSLRRIDKWLWCARRFKTRSLAARFVSDESVRVTRAGLTQRIDRPAFALRIGDEVSYLLGEKLVVLAVTGFASRRGPPEAAKLLCSDAKKPSRKSDDLGAAPACKADGCR